LNQYVIKIKIQKSIDIPNAQVSGSETHFPPCGVGDAYPVPPKPSAVGKRHAMMRPFLTRFPNSLIGVVLLVLCLLICLVCATPLPVETLEEGMTPLAVRQAVGEPRFIAPNGVWIYTHEEQNPGEGVVRSDVFLHFDDERLVQWQMPEPIPLDLA
jgi:hypothetical protein